MAKFNKLNYKLLSQSRYSPDFVPSDQFLFLNLKTWPGGKRFGDEIIAVQTNGEKVTETFSLLPNIDSPVCQQNRANENKPPRLSLVLIIFISKNPLLSFGELLALCKISFVQLLDNHNFWW